MAELEYKTMVQERNRLARESHDGLAQTLGFLKLHVAQMQNYLAREDYDRLRQSVDLCYATLSEAYQEARVAIDGLRIRPSDSGLTGWLEQTVGEFQEISGLSVEVEKIDLRMNLPPEVHAQLIRIVQEALSNIRKHAQAERVFISCWENEGDLWLEIRDDGQGFSPQDIPGPSRHGLRGMRERAELIGADFQIISRSNEGTTVRVRLPLSPSPNYSSQEENI
jgi:two-component system nitrate/nitrite sensor histidine kinase NarX